MGGEGPLKISCISQLLMIFCVKFSSLEIENLKVLLVYLKGMGGLSGVGVTGFAGDAGSGFPSIHITDDGKGPT